VAANTCAAARWEQIKNIMSHGRGQKIASSRPRRDQSACLPSSTLALTVQALTCSRVVHGAASLPFRGTRERGPVAERSEERIGAGEVYRDLGGVADGVFLRALARLGGR
jgi:hypothetical protein